MKTIVITGASAGIGLATADRFARSGWQVAIIARDPVRLDEAKTMLEQHGGKVLAIPVDVADAKAIDEAANKVVAEFGAIDAWVNNAMSTVVARAHDITPEEYARVTATTYLSQVYGTLAALRYMRRRDQGAIIQVSFGLAIRAAPLQTAYCGAKAAVGGFTDSLRSELISDKSKITLSVVYLPGVNTPQTSWARNHTGREQVIPDPLFNSRLCAEAIWAAAHDPQREFWVGRSTLMMALGQSVTPGFSDRGAAGMIDKQQGDPMPKRAGNLDVAVPGPARIDGDGTDRVKGSRREFFTSRQRDMLKAGVVGGLLSAGALAGDGASRALPRFLR